MADDAAAGAFRRFFRNLLAGVARRIAAAGIGPNWLTALSLPPALAAGFAAAAGIFVAAAILLLIAGLLDMLDGAVARAAGRESRFGALLDSTLDRIADAAVPAGLVVFYAPHGAVALVPVLALVAAFAISYVRARAQSLGIALPRLWMRREDRILALVAALFLAPLPLPGTALPAPLLLLALAALAGLGILAAAAALVAAARRG